MATPNRVTEALAAHRRGWVLTPLKGKVPLRQGWQREPPPDEATVKEWAKAGNVGLRTGPISGVFVIDVDSVKGGAFPEYTTPTVLTGGGGRHMYFVVPTPSPGNTSSKLATRVDTRGDGGQVVYVGSVHPKTGEIYRWAPGLSPDEVPLLVLPDEILSALEDAAHREPKAIAAPRASTPSHQSRYGAKALDSELARLSEATEGQRNDTLNRCAYALGQLVGGDVLSHGDVSGQLLSAAIAVGLSESEAARTIRSGIESGMKNPRRPKIHAVPRGAAPAADSPPQPPGIPDVLIPGAHVTEDGEYIEVGADDFARQVLATLPPGALYRRAPIVGQIFAGRFSPVSNARMRLIVDAHMRFVRWKASSKGDPPVRTFRPCDQDHAALILAAAESDPTVRDLRMFVTYPVLAPVSTTNTLAPVLPGWNADSGIYYDEPPALAGIEPNLDPSSCYAVLSDLLCDFPFAEPSDFENYVGLLLTPFVRPAVLGNAPLHLIVSPLERTGKTKLAEIVLGIITTGSPAPAFRLSEHEDEGDKRIIAALIDGDPIMHLDNIGDMLDSGTLASLITSQTYKGRILGRSANISLPNDLTIVATGNNVRMSSEIAKRSVPIRLAPATDEPESRTDFRHPDCEAYVRSQRRTVIAALLGAAALWSRAPHPRPLGGFEGWSRLVGGVLEGIGMTAWRTNELTWRGSADTWGEDLRAFVAAWADSCGTEWAAPPTLLGVADRAGAFSGVIRGDTEKARLNSFTQRVMKRICDAPSGAYVIRRIRIASGTVYRLSQK